MAQGNAPPRECGWRDEMAAQKARGMALLATIERLEAAEIEEEANALALGAKRAA